MNDIARHNLERFDAKTTVASYLDLEGLTPAEADLFDRHVPSAATILDLGVGTGRTSTWLAGRASTYEGIDLAPAMVQAAIDCHPTLDFRVADAADLGWNADGSVEVVVFSFNGIDYLPDDVRAMALSEIHRVLGPGGIFLFSMHNPRAFVTHPADLRGGAVRRWALAAGLSVRRLARCATRRAAWTGSGWLLDPAAGGLHTHASSPARVRTELADHGFELIEVAAGDWPRRPARFRTPWWYYAARRSA